MENLTLYILTATIILLVIMLAYVASVKNKQFLHKIFLVLIFQLIIWNATVLLGCIFKDNVPVFLFIENFPYFGAAFVPVTLIQLALAYDKNYKGTSKKVYLLYAIPILTMLMVWTNNWHHLFYLSYSPETGYVLGPYFYVHAAYSYICMMIGMIFLCYYAMKNTGKLSVQAVLVFLGCIFPLVTNICYTLGVPGFSVSSTPVAFTVTILLYILAMMKFDFLKVMPIALQTVMNRISDSFVVIDTDLNILDYNESFRRNFLVNTAVLTSGQKKVGDWLDDLKLSESQKEKLLRYIDVSAHADQTLSMDIDFMLGSEQRYYTVEFTSITNRNVCNAVIVLFKDITQHIMDLETIKKNQEILLERERLASLGQMIGGIAHNLKTPIMSVSGGIEQLACLVDEYRDSIGDPEVLPEDHREISAEMLEWLQKMRSHMSYMSDIISTVKDQAAQFNASQKSSFSLDELMKRVKILMQHELIKNNCVLTEKISADPSTQIDGDLNSLVQIMDNIIANAVQAYEGAGGEIQFSAKKADDEITFCITDFGGGIDEKIQDRLFKQMVTTKGKHGTGLGLYMSYSTIKGVFGGDMWFESEFGKGTSFFIQIPVQG